MNIRNNVSLSQVLYYGIGGTVKYLLETKNKEDVLAALDFVAKKNIKKFFVVGLGSNIIYPDGYLDTAVIHIARENNNSINITGDGLVETFAGETLDNVIQYAFANNLTGLEWAGGLPGTVGAGVRGNVGAFGSEIKNVFHQAEIIKISDDGKFEVIQIQDGEFSYRNSVIKKEKNVILSVVLQLTKSDKDQADKARQIYTNNITYRNQHHPMEYPSCGSVFKNIMAKNEIEKVLRVYPDIEPKFKTVWHNKISVGYLINRLGFTGYQRGKAKVSEKHSNFIVNLGGAKFNDVVEIINEIREKIYSTFGFSPEPEVEIVKLDI